MREEESRLIVPEDIKEALVSYHFTETNRAKFQKVYKKWRSIFPNKSLIDRKQNIRTANDLIRALERDLSAEVKNWKLT